MRALQADIMKFCAAYQLDAFRCAEELFSFATTFSKFNCSPVRETDKYEDLGSNDGEMMIQMRSMVVRKFVMTKKTFSDNPPLNWMSTKIRTERQNAFIDALKLLSFPEYHLVDAYLTSYQVHAIAVAMPISSAAAERLFSALKELKQGFTQLRCKIVLSHYF